MMIVKLILFLCRCFSPKLARSFVVFLKNANKNKNPQRLQEISRRRVFVDVSLLAEGDVGTGIQRVVKGIIRGISFNHDEFDIFLIRCSRSSGFVYVDHELARQLGAKSVYSELNLSPRFGDVFLGLDLNSRYIFHHDSQLLAWKRGGVKFVFFVYDMLPRLYPKWFRYRSVIRFNRWLRFVYTYADTIVAISDSVNADVKMWQRKISGGDVNIPCSTIPMGSDFLTQSSCTANFKEVLINSSYLLAVGTIEPRKGYDALLVAMQSLWSSHSAGQSTALVIVGRPGWNTDKLQRKILEIAKESNNQLFWFANADDTLLSKLYVGASGVVVCSRAEGYGLPLLEAMSYRKPIFVRNIPVFHEVIGMYPDAQFFESDLDLKLNLPIWVANLTAVKEHSFVDCSTSTWMHAGERLISVLREL